MDRVPARAQLLIVLRLEIKATVEIKRRTAFGEAGTNSGAVGETKSTSSDPDSSARRMAATGMHLGPLCSTHSICGITGWGWTGSAG